MSRDDSKPRDPRDAGDSRGAEDADRPSVADPPPDGDPPIPGPPSKRRLLIASGAALVVAALVLVTVVLPAEYDIDPLGTGRALGLVVLGEGTGAIPVREDGLTAQPATYRVDRRSFVLPPGGWVEYKYRLEAGQAMIYSWEASNWVRSEMHSEADGAPEGTAEFFEVAEETLHRHGSYTAPFPGIHGWYWLNESSDTVTVTVRAAGFFTNATVFREDVAPEAFQLETTPDALDAEADATAASPASDAPTGGGTGIARGSGQAPEDGS